LFGVGARAQQSAATEQPEIDASSQPGLSATLPDTPGLMDSLVAGHIVYKVKILDYTGPAANGEALNNYAQIVGERETPDRQSYQAAIWNGRNASAWRTFAKPYSVAFDINDSGLIAGIAVLHNATRGVLWRRGKLFELGDLGGRTTDAYAINARGWVAGSSNTAGNQEAHATLWKGFKPIDLGTLPGGNNSVGRGVNDYGDVAGESNSGAGDINQSFAALWKNGRVYNLGLAGGDQSHPRAINNKDQIVGYRSLGSGPSFVNVRAILWENGKARDLGTLGGTNGVAFAINQAGLIVGGSQNSRNQNRGTLWYGSHIVDINSLLAPDTKGIDIFDARDINDRGEILAVGNTPHGGRFLLLTPVRRDR
jgi:probable HAF family extracellular repeat protein